VSRSAKAIGSENYLKWPSLAFTVGLDVIIY